MRWSVQVLDDTTVVLERGGVGWDDLNAFIQAHVNFAPERHFLLETAGTSWDVASNGVDVTRVYPAEVQS